MSIDLNVFFGNYILIRFLILYFIKIERSLIMPRWFVYVCTIAIVSSYKSESELHPGYLGSLCVYVCAYSLSQFSCT